MVMFSLLVSINPDDIQTDIVSWWDSSLISKGENPKSIMTATRQPFFFTAQACTSALYPDSIYRGITKLTTEFEPRRQFTGGILSVVVYRGGSSPEYSVKTIQIGKPGKATFDFMFFAAEKIRRLHDRRAKGGSDFASSQSAHTAGQYGGCIVATTSGGAEVYFSFAGAPDVVDEAVVFVLAEKLGLIVPEGYENPLLERARELLEGCALNASPE